MNVGMNERLTYKLLSYWEGKYRHQGKIFCLYLGVRKVLAAGSRRPEVSTKKRGVVAVAVIPLMERKRHISLTHWLVILITPAIPIS